MRAGLPRLGAQLRTGQPAQWRSAQKWSKASDIKSRCPDGGFFEGLLALNHSMKAYIKRWKHYHPRCRLTLESMDSVLRIDCRVSQVVSLLLRKNCRSQICDLDIYQVVLSWRTKNVVYTLDKHGEISFYRVWHCLHSHIKGGYGLCCAPSLRFDSRCYRPMLFSSGSTGCKYPT